MKCLKPYHDKKNNRYFACGQCYACRVNYTSMWSLRLLYELKNWDCASFLTLTYDDEHLQSDSLVKKDFTDFMKRVRRDLPKDRKIRYYMCGEYGSKNFRPHFHSIIYGLDNYNQNDRDLIRENWKKCDDFLFEPISRVKKHSAIEPVCRESIQYVCGYVQKKLKGGNAKELYDDNGLVRPYNTCSNGIGLNFCMENSERLIKNGFTFYNGHKIGIPRYFRDKLGIKQVDLINNSDSVFDERQSQVVDDVEKDFIAYCKKNYNIDYEKSDSNLTLKSIRFERFLEQRMYDISRQIEKDFLKKQNFKGGQL